MRFLSLQERTTKNSSFLSSIDTKIESTNQQITQRRALKKACAANVCKIWIKQKLMNRWIDHMFGSINV
jgi:hypothetical protein